MIHHIVLFKFKEHLAAEVLEEKINQLRALEHIVEGVKSFHVGKDVTGKSQGYDIALFAVFESKEALDKYYPHPQHVALVNELRSGFTDNWIVVDYEA